MRGEMPEKNQNFKRYYLVEIKKTTASSIYNSTHA
jgi:hypothetical protein